MPWSGSGPPKRARSVVEPTVVGPTRRPRRARRGTPARGRRPARGPRRSRRSWRRREAGRWARRGRSSGLLGRVDAHPPRAGQRRHRATSLRRLRGNRIRRYYRLHRARIARRSHIPEAPDDPRRRQPLAGPLRRGLAAPTSPAAIGDLFAEDAEYRYHAWDEPLQGRDAIVARLDRRTSDAPGTYEAEYTALGRRRQPRVATGTSRYVGMPATRPTTTPTCSSSTVPAAADVVHRVLHRGALRRAGPSGNSASRRAARGVSFPSPVARTGPPTARDRRATRPITRGG